MLILVPLSVKKKKKSEGQQWSISESYLLNHAGNKHEPVFCINFNLPIILLETFILWCSRHPRRQKMTRAKQTNFVTIKIPEKREQLFQFETVVVFLSGILSMQLVHCDFVVNKIDLNWFDLTCPTWISQHTTRVLVVCWLLINGRYVKRKKLLYSSSLQRFIKDKK